MSFNIKTCNECNHNIISFHENNKILVGIFKNNNNNILTKFEKQKSCCHFYLFFHYLDIKDSNKNKFCVVGNKINLKIIVQNS